MIDETRELRRKVSFVPFTIHMADGRQFQVPTLDHFLVAGRRATIVLNDTDFIEILPALLISGITTDHSALPAEPFKE